ncbi:MAG: SH3 domain-containing protein [Candidatus Omnitrophica bacterium]|nr:SH3 domain-containing protein [Candidatus Omnitrophota bacterium]
MNYIKSLIVLFSLVTLTAYAQEEAKEKFPKVGYVKDDGAIVKAGDNENFETLCTLLKADSVKIIDRRYSWLKILLPRKAALYINSDYVTLTSDEKGIGIINAANVNLRAGAGTRYSIIGQISKPEKVSILSEDAGWYKVEPPYGIAGWIHSKQIDITTDKNEIDPSEQKETVKKKNLIPSVLANQKEATSSSTIRLNANYPAPTKGNLSVSTSTKNNR